MFIDFDTSSIESYRQFLRVKQVPSYSWKGMSAVVPDEYHQLIAGGDVQRELDCRYTPSAFCFDYQAGISRLACVKRKFAVFADCGLGKTVIQFEFAKHIKNSEGNGRLLLLAPSMVVDQTITEAERFYGGELQIGKVRASNLQEWLNGDGFAIGITNYESIREGLQPGNLIGLILDESSTLKSHYGAWGLRLIELGRGLKYKLAMTGTPAPNDRVEFANHAVFLDQCRSVNEFLAKYFVNKGQTQERWILKPHALRPFYRDLSHWCIFLSDPSVYGWKDNSTGLPPIHIHIESVDLTPEQRQAVQSLTGSLMSTSAGGIGQRSKLMQIAKGANGIPTNKPGFIRNSVDSWPEESTIIWCHYNDEQDAMERVFPGAASIQGKTKMETRLQLISEFKDGSRKVLISKPDVIGFGLNLQVATRQIFNGMNDSYEDFYQAVKRSNRVGSKRPLNVHIPITEIEEPMVSNVLQKAHRVELDAKEQEKLFKEMATEMQCK